MVVAIYKPFAKAKLFTNVNSHLPTRLERQCKSWEENIQALILTGNIYNYMYCQTPAKGTVKKKVFQVWPQGVKSSVADP